MKGVYYNMKIKIIGDEFKEYKKINIHDVLFNIQKDLYEIHHIKQIVNNNMVYNLIKRPYCVNRLLRHYIEIDYYVKNSIDNSIENNN